MNTPALRRISLRELYKYRVFDSRGKYIGTIDDVLFHPTRPLAIGCSMKPRRLLRVIKRHERYIRLDALKAIEGIEEKQLQVVGGKDVWNKRAEKVLGFSWDDSVIWYGQHIHTCSGEHIGRVSDALVDLVDGSVGAIEVTYGSLSDSTLGKRTIPVQLIEQFDLDGMHAIIVSDEALQCRFQGGLAMHAGHATDAVQNAAKTVAKTAPVVVKAAPRIAKKVAKAAPAKAGRLVGSLKKSFQDGYNEGLESD